jgi:hypothetical protein
MSKYTQPRAKDAPPHIRCSWCKGHGCVVCGLGRHGVPERGYPIEATLRDLVDTVIAGDIYDAQGVFDFLRASGYSDSSSSEET